MCKVGLVLIRSNKKLYVEYLFIRNALNHFFHYTEGFIKFIQSCSTSQIALCTLYLNIREAALMLLRKELLWESSINTANGSCFSFEPH